MARKDVIRPYFAKMIVKQLLIAAYQLVEEGSNCTTDAKIRSLCLESPFQSQAFVNLCKKAPFVEQLSSTFCT